MKIADGWLFETADFSMQARGRAYHGHVTLIRIQSDVERWYKLPDEIRFAIGGPRIEVKGFGKTFEEAIADANEVAERATPLP